MKPMKPFIKFLSYALPITAVATWAIHADAATLRQYTPGGAPCAGACTLPWAQAEFGVPEGVPARMVIPKGAVVSQMSYGRDGAPYAMSDSAILTSDQPGEGYAFERAGTTFWMVKLDECENWAVVQIPAGYGGAFLWDPMPITPVTTPRRPPVVWTAPAVVLTLVVFDPAPPSRPGPTWTPLNPTDPVEPVPPVVPLPASAWMFTAVLAGFLSLRCLKNFTPS